MEFPEALIVQPPISIAIHQPDDHLCAFQETWYLLQPPPEIDCRDLLKALIPRAIVWTSFLSLGTKRKVGLAECVDLKHLPLVLLPEQWIYPHIPLANTYTLTSGEPNLIMTWNRLSSK